MWSWTGNMILEVHWISLIALFTHLYEYSLAYVSVMVASAENSWKKKFEIINPTFKKLI